MTDGQGPHATGVELDVTEGIVTRLERTLSSTNLAGRAKGRRPDYPLRRLIVRPAKRGRQEASLRR